MAVPPIIDVTSRTARARDLEALGFNGLRMVLVDLLPAVNPTEARLEVFLFSTVHRNDILADAGVDPAGVFRISGGLRIRAGSGTGQVAVSAVAAGSASDSLFLTVRPIGDYSTYTLSVAHTNIDPFFDEINFRFRPGCFSTNCAPEWDRSPAPPEQPAIDYLAKDYESFRHTLIAAMMQRVPRWRSTSEADLDQVLIDLFAAAADELSDYQDRVMNEAYLASCRKRVSLARHARLMDYHIHQGNQASTWLALEVSAAFSLPPGFRFTPTFDLHPMLEVWTGADPPVPGSAFFSARDRATFDPRLNTLAFYTWNNAEPALRAGSTSAYLSAATFADAQYIVERINGTHATDPQIEQLILQEHLNPNTGQEPGRDRNRRQVLRLTRAELAEDTVRAQQLVRVFWRDEDRLRHNYVFTSFCPQGPVTNVSRFHGNVIRVHEGRLTVASFYEEGSVLPTTTPTHFYGYFDRTDRYGVLCHLPALPLAYEATPPGGEIAPNSTAHVEVEIAGGGSDPWDEVISLVHSDDSEENGDHFGVETDELQRSLLRFGNGTNGREVPPNARVHCAYQTGGGVRGNIGFDSLLHFEAGLPLTRVWNPFDVTDGRDPESVERIVRNAPEAYRARQLRAITLGDYIRRAQEVEGVSRAAARYLWTGSWRTVRIVIDPAGTLELSDDLRTRVFHHLEAVRLIGEDLELRAPRFAPLDITVTLCVHPHVWPEDVRFVLEQEFSTGFTPDGRRAFFHPDNWTFGQTIHRSEIEGRVHEVSGVEHIISITMKRFSRTGSASSANESLEAAADEIFLVENDPDHLERGIIRFDLRGGRQ